MKKILAIVFYIVGLFAIAFTTYAATPTCSATLTGTGDNVSLYITGDPNSSAILNYLNSSSAVQMSSLGTTNSNGNLLITISTAAYGIAPGSSFYVTVNNQQSSTSVMAVYNHFGNRIILFEPNQPHINSRAILDNNRI